MVYRLCYPVRVRRPSDHRRSRLTCALAAVPPLDIVVPLIDRVPGPRSPSTTAPGRRFDPLATGAIPVGNCSTFFRVSVLRNVVHLLFGRAGLITARTARVCLTVGGSPIWCCEPLPHRCYGRPQPLKPSAGRSQRRTDDRVEQFPIPTQAPSMRPGRPGRGPWICDVKRTRRLSTATSS